ncbi:hypothetical protein F4804DRAFT_23248 [Jackrogersella minutella]|nr:hypothetical protein F4804DRAFT_23248 [Jackrogersella minutella]
MGTVFFLFSSLLNVQLRNNFTFLRLLLYRLAVLTKKQNQIAITTLDKYLRVFGNGIATNSFSHEATIPTIDLLAQHMPIFPNTLSTLDSCYLPRSP